MIDRNLFLKLIIDSYWSIDSNEINAFEEYLKSLALNDNELPNTFFANLNILKVLLNRIRDGFKPLENHPSINIFINEFCNLKLGDEKKIAELTNLVFPNDCYFIFQEKGVYSDIFDSEPNNIYLGGLDEISQFLKFKSLNYFANSIEMLVRSYYEGFFDTNLEVLRKWVEGELYDLVHIGEYK